MVGQRLNVHGKASDLEEWANFLGGFHKIVHISHTLGFICWYKWTHRSPLQQRGGSRISKNTDLSLKTTISFSPTFSHSVHTIEADPHFTSQNLSSISYWVGLTMPPRKELLAIDPDSNASNLVQDLSFVVNEFLRTEHYKPISVGNLNTTPYAFFENQWRGCWFMDS